MNKMIHDCATETFLSSSTRSIQVCIEAQRKSSGVFSQAILFFFQSFCLVPFSSRSLPFDRVHHVFLPSKAGCVCLCGAFIARRLDGWKKLFSAIPPGVVVFFVVKVRSVCWWSVEWLGTICNATVVCGFSFSILIKHRLLGR